MGYLPGFRNDVFISYPHLNEWDGWVSDFHARLEAKLREILSSDVTVWRDTRLRYTNVLSEEIYSQLRRAGVLVAIASPGREASEWCARELEEFRAAADRFLGFRLGTLQRAVVVAKTPVEKDRQRDVVPDALCVEFFEGKALDFTEFPPGSDEYNSRLSRLAQDVAVLLKEITRRLTVYLAGAADDARPLWEKLYHELTDRNFIVRPPGWLEQGHLEHVLRQWLGECCLSVHVLGEDYHEFTVRQLELARELAVPRIIWVPQGIGFKGKQQSFLDDLREDPGGAALLDQKRLDYVKDFLRERLARPEEAAPLRAAEQRGLVFLACDTEDHPMKVLEENNALRIRQYLHKLGFVVDLPVPGQRRDAENKLKWCDAVIFYWGNAAWRFVDKMTTSLCRKVRPEDKSPFRCKIVYITDPKGLEKERYESPEVEVVRQFGPFDPETLKPLLAAFGTPDSVV